MRPARRWVKVAISVGPARLRSRARVAFVIAITAKTSVPSTRTPGIQIRSHVYKCGFSQNIERRSKNDTVSHVSISYCSVTEIGGDRLRTLIWTATHCRTKIVEYVVTTHEHVFISSMPEWISTTDKSSPLHLYEFHWVIDAHLGAAQKSIRDNEICTTH